MGDNAVGTKSDIVLRKNSSELKRQESVIADGMRTFVDVGRALMAIRDSQLYLAAGFASFEKYCKSKWQFSRGYAYKLMTASEIATQLSPNGDIVPLGEAHMRPLSQVPAEDRQSVWDKICETAPNGVITAKHVTNAVKDYLDQDHSRYPDESCEGLAPVGDSSQDSDIDREISKFNRKIVSFAEGVTVKARKQLAHELREMAALIEEMK